MSRRRGQSSASGAAGLVAVIATMIFLYILFLPDADRAALLGGDEGTKPVPRDGLPQYKNILLSQNAGRIFPPAPNEVEHTIPSFTIFTSTNAAELKRASSLAVKKGIFTEESPVLTFRYDPRKMSDPVLSFNARKSGGTLIILLNGEQIYSAELESGSPDPISLPEGILEETNELTFMASSSGAAFWKVNTHELSSVIISAEVTDRSGAVSAQHFSIPPAEYELMTQAQLSFLPNCDAKFTGRLSIAVNTREVYSGFADCGIPNKLEIAKELLKPGDNTLTFVSDQGQYLVDLVKVTSKMSGQDVPVFYFNVPNYMYDRVYYGDALLFVTLRFADARSVKSGVLNINGYESSFQVRDIIYQTQVDPEFLLPGPNSIIIIPQGQPLDVVEIRVEST